MTFTTAATQPARTLRLQPQDNIVVAVDTLEPGRENGAGVSPRARVPKGHKMAIEPIPTGAPILKFGQIIGFATLDIAPGDWVHEHNVEMQVFARDYHFAEGAKPEPVLPLEQQATFQGFRRANGKAGTRNYLAILTSVNCSASVARFMAKEIERSGLLENHPEIDGVIALVHGTGCGIASKGEGFEALKRTQWGYASNPNIAGVLLVGLGCEVFQIGRMKSEYGLRESDAFRTMTIQDTGGTRKTVEAGVAALRDMIPAAARARRETLPASDLVLALQCGGSDGYSGITANPALGAAADLLVRHGGTAILSETPEIYGAEHLLTRRAATREVGEKLVGMIRWWEDYTARAGGEMNNNPSPGNKAGGLTTILEKSLGAAAKGGTTTLTGVLPLRRAGHRQGLRVHGYAGLRPRLGHRPGGGRRQHPVLHDRSRLGLRLQAHALDQAFDEHRRLPPHGRGHGHQLRRHPRRRVDRSEGPGDLRQGAGGRVGRAVEVRGARLRRRGVRALADRRHNVRPGSESGEPIRRRHGAGGHG